LLETPDLEWIVRNGAFVDLMYEHCNYFSNRSLRRILLKAGFQLQRMERVFEDQYFLLTAHKQESVQEQPLPVAAISQAVKHFCAAEPKLKQSWLDRLAAAANKGPTAVWGAGAKGVSFVSLLDPDRLLVDCLIDVNPAKQGRFVALTGHQIVSPETAVARGVLAALVMNPNYLDEIRNQLSALAAPVELISLGETPNEIYH
jgi:hypothetical protein